MVSKIFKAASSGQEQELNSLLDKVEQRAHDMVKPVELPEFVPPQQPIHLPKTSTKSLRSRLDKD